MQRVHEDFENGDVVVLGISLDADGLQAVQPYLEEHGYTMPTLLDGDMEVGRRFGVHSTPATFIVNRRGMIVASSSGPVNFDHPQFREYIQTLSDTEISY